MQVRLFSRSLRELPGEHEIVEGGLDPKQSPKTLRGWNAGSCRPEALYLARMVLMSLTSFIPFISAKAGRFALGYLGSAMDPWVNLRRPLELIRAVRLENRESEKERERMQHLESRGHATLLAITVSGHMGLFLKTRGPRHGWYFWVPLANPPKGVSPNQDKTHLGRFRFPF